MTEERDKVGPPASDRGVYGISVAAELSGISQQTLRLYERHGLVTPVRSVGGTRRYSADDLYRLQRISELTADGVNLAGVARILSLEDRNAALDDRNVALEDDNTALRDDISRRKSPAQSSASPTANRDLGQAKRSPRRRKS
jgi:MerR family transcriptional regulator, heat shock protein HspR